VTVVIMILNIMESSGCRYIGIVSQTSSKVFKSSK